MTDAVLAVDVGGTQLRAAIVGAPNLPAGWAPHLNRAAPETHLGVPVELANDADAAAVGEALFGAGRGYEDVVYLAVSTGIGAGVLLGGRLVASTRSTAEVGHTILDLRAPQEGRPSTLEDLGSGTALGRLAAAGMPPDGEKVLELVRCGARNARRVWDGVVDAVAAGVHNLVHLFTPDVVVLGGGVGRTQDLLEPGRVLGGRHRPAPGLRSRDCGCPRAPRRRLTQGRAGRRSSSWVR